MILTEVNFFSETLGLLSSMYVILPQRTLADAQNKPRKKFRTLYLLHGRSDDHSAWQRQISIERYVEGFNLVVVMPAVHLSYYTDMAMSFIAPDALFINPTGTYEGMDAIRESLAGLNTDGITFDLSNLRNTDGTIVYDYEVLQSGNVLDKGTNGLTIVRDGLIVFDGTEDTQPVQ